MRPLRIFMAPVTTPGRITLQADRETWEQLLVRLPEARPLTRDIGQIAISTALAADTDTTVVRVTFPDERARQLLALAGVSS